MAETTIALLYAATTVIFIIAGLVMVGMAIRAYVETAQPAMLHLSLGFSFAVAGAAATMISAFLWNFEGAEVLLLVKSGFFTVGFIFIIYSILAYR